MSIEGMDDVEESFIYMKLSVDKTGQFLSSAEFAADSKFILDLTDEQIEEISHSFREFRGFLDAKSIKSLIEPVVPDTQQRDRLVVLLPQLYQAIARTGKGIDSLISDLRERRTRLSEESVNAEQLDHHVRRRLSLLLDEQPAFQRQYKAERLVNLVGNPLSTINIICDLRPVFDPRHIEVEGSLIVTTLRAIATGPDGLPVAFEARLTEKQIAELANEGK